MSDMAAPISEQAQLRPISVVEYHRMGEANILGPDERVELLNGRIIEMPPIGPDHAYTVTELDELLRARFHGRAVVRDQQPLTLDSFSEPEPDLVLARGPSVRYKSAHPSPVDTLLVIEVSHSSLPTDRGEKLAAYARSGVPEYWIVNIVDEVVEQHADPAGSLFRSHRIFRRGERIAPNAFPADAIAIEEILGTIA
jgi:Uma2 family endonuclease